MLSQDGCRQHPLVSSRQLTLLNSGLYLLASMLSSWFNCLSSDIGRTNVKQSLLGNRALMDARICGSMAGLTSETGMPPASFLTGAVT